jgi:hypothetical protein
LCLLAGAAADGVDAATAKDAPKAQAAATFKGMNRGGLVAAATAAVAEKMCTMTAAAAAPAAACQSCKLGMIYFGLHSQKCKRVL